MTTVFSPAKKAYDPSLGKKRPWDKPGVYTMSHVTGYGLLYQLTGDKKYADLGRQGHAGKIVEQFIHNRLDRTGCISGWGMAMHPALGMNNIGHTGAGAADRLVSGQSVHPLHTDSVQQLRNHAAKGARLVKLHPTVQSFYPDDQAWRDAVVGIAQEVVGAVLQAPG